VRDRQLIEFIVFHSIDERSIQNLGITAFGVEAFHRTGNQSRSPGRLQEPVPSLAPLLTPLTIHIHKGIPIFHHHRPRKIDTVSIRLFITSHSAPCAILLSRTA